MKRFIPARWNFTINPVWLLLFVISVFSLPVQAQTEELILVDEQPIPEGGLNKFYDYISENLKMPDEARQKGTQGRVYVQFMIDRHGLLSDAQVIHGIGSGCDEEALRLVKAYPGKWIPAQAGGKPVSVEMSLPIRFAIETIQAKK